MKRNKDDREMFFDSQAYFSAPYMPPPIQNSSMMYSNPNMMGIPNYQMNPYYNQNDNELIKRIAKLEKFVKVLEERIYKLETKENNSSSYQTTNNNYSNNDTYML